MKLNQEEIKKYIPHRDPMLFVDRVVDYDLEKREMHAQYDVKKNWDVFKGHFPNAPIMPGVLITEACAQVTGVLTNMILGRTAEDTLFYFMAIEKVRFRQPVHPESILDFKVSMVKNKGFIYKYKAKAYVNDVLVAEAEFTAKVIAK
ncbi:MAG: 3-hydroxyacyl-ACP dehydratase FabZ [Proteobacteria bacterium]|nr:3-hydroxyacyl-ACP dehydratase FabZ [Pseudomonadota bacterium]